MHSNTQTTDTLRADNTPGTPPVSTDAHDNSSQFGDAPCSPPLTFPELRGEVLLDHTHLLGVDTRYGVPVHLGAVVQCNECCPGILIGGTADVAVMMDEKGMIYAERWGGVFVQASGPGAGVITGKYNGAYGVHLKRSQDRIKDTLGLLQDASHLAQEETGQQLLKAVRESAKLLMAANEDLAAHARQAQVATA